VGLATGEAVAATEPIREFMVTGEVANLAARLQSAAPGIVVSEDTHRLVTSVVESERLGPLSLKGFPAPVTAYLVTGVRPTPAPRGIPGLSSPMVGRDQEMGALRRCAEELAGGRGQIVSIIGEPGIGKSRLKIELRERLPAGVRWLEGRCQAYTRTMSYAPLVQILRPIFLLASGEPQAVARTKLRVTLRSLVGTRYEHVHPVVAHLLGIEPDQALPASVDPRALQTQLVFALRAVVAALSARGPLILALEDLHWADPATIEILTVLSELSDLAPLMILVTARADPEGGSWDFRFHAQRNYAHRLTELTLSQLAPTESERLVGNLLRFSELPDHLRDQVLEPSEGNPLFVEEIIRTLIEEGVLRREGDRWIAPGDMRRVVIPATLRGVIAARIDRLPPAAKATLQRASVIGRFLPYHALQALHEGEDDLDRSLAHLLRAELIREGGQRPEREYFFKHVLTQETAYAGLLAEPRRALHARLAAYLEQTPGGASGEQAALLAHHWLRAEEWDKALRCTLESAERAHKLYARPEAIAHFWQALELLERLPKTTDRRRAHAAVVLSLVRVPGWMRNEAGRKAGFEHIDEAMRTASETGDIAALAQLEGCKGYFSDDEDLLLRAIAHAEASGDRLTDALASTWYGDHLGPHGQYEKALTHIARAVDLFGTLGERYEQAMQMASIGRCYCSRAGRLGEALGYAARAREIGEELGDARVRAWGAMEAEPYMYQGLWDQVIRVAEEGLPVAWEIREWPVIFFTSAWLGLAHLKRGRVDDAMRVLGRTIKEGQAASVVSFGWTYLQTALAHAHLIAGETTEALAAARKALEFADRSRFRLEQGAAHRVLGQVHEAMGNRREADVEFRQSLEILAEIQSRPELAQTLLAYGRFRLSDDLDAGRALIERARSLFEEMDATGWIEEARAALTPSR
jgi:tetratricopeptide (TPR) repeat protein